MERLPLPPNTGSFLNIAFIGSLLFLFPVLLMGWLKDVLPDALTSSSSEELMA